LAEVTVDYGPDRIFDVCKTYMRTQDGSIASARRDPDETVLDQRGSGQKATSSDRESTMLAAPRRVA